MTHPPRHSQPAIRQKFIGAWQLVSIEIRSSGRVRSSPVLGPNPVGLLIYSETHVLAMLMKPDRPDFAHAGHPTAEEMSRSFRGFFAYGGRWEVNEEEQCVLHYTDVDRIPNEVGGVKKRRYEFAHGLLKLSPPSAIRGGRETSVMTLTWRRLE